MRVVANGVALAALMGMPLTKELLHHSTWISSLPADNVVMVCLASICRIILGDDLFQIREIEEFYRKSSSFGLKVEKSKKPKGLVVPICDRYMSVVYIGDKYYLFGSTFVPLKLLAPLGKGCLAGIMETTTSR